MGIKTETLEPLVREFTLSTSEWATAAALLSLAASVKRIADVLEPFQPITAELAGRIQAEMRDA